MIVNVAPASGDDPSYLASLCGMLAALVEQHRPEVVHLVRIDNWFDHKWLRFSGIGRVAFDPGYPKIDTALDAMWQSELTFPPFSPGRVVSEESFYRETKSRYARAAALVVHSGARDHSAKNLQRRVANEFPSAVFTWFSSESANSGHASLLVYEIAGAMTSAWYSSFLRKNGAWTVRHCKGIERARLVSLFPLDA